MLRAVLLLVVFATPAVHNIIVKDPPSTENEYKYSYDVEDPSTGDSKSQHESRRGVVVSGAYSVVEPDGTRRTVQYTADPEHGFNALVSREPWPAPAGGVGARASPAPEPLQYQYPVDSAHSSAYVAANAGSHLPSFYYRSFPEEQSLYFTPGSESANEIRVMFRRGQNFMPASK